MIQPLTYPGISLGAVDNFAARSIERKTMNSLSSFGCRRCGCTPTAACLDDHGNQCTWITPQLCSHCRDTDHTEAAAMMEVPWDPAITTPPTEKNETTGPPSSTPATNPSADDAQPPSPPVNPSTSAIAKTSHSAAANRTAHPNTRTATAPPAKPSAPTPHHPATGDPQLDAELEWTLR